MRMRSTQAGLNGMGGMGHLPRVARARAAAGATLIELLLAVMFLLGAGVTMLASYHANFHLMELAQQSTMAVNDLRDMIERIKDSAFTSLATGFPNGVANGPAGNPYATVVGGYGLTQEQITVTYPAPNTDPLQVVVTLTWTNRNRAYTRSTSTVRTGSTS